MSDQVSVSVLNLNASWKKPTIPVVTYHNKSYVSRTALVIALGGENGIPDKYFVDLTQFGVSFPTPIRSGIELKNIPKLIKSMKKFTSEEKKQLIEGLDEEMRLNFIIKGAEKKRERDEPAVKPPQAPKPPARMKEVEVGGFEMEAALPQKKRYSSPPLTCNCAELLIDRMIELEKSVLANCQLGGQVLYRNSEKFQEDRKQWEAEERAVMRDRIDKKELVPYINAKKEEIDKIAERTLEPVRAQKLAELEREIELLRAKRIDQLKNDSTKVVDEVNQFLLNKKN